MNHIDRLQEWNEYDDDAIDGEVMLACLRTHKHYCLVMGLCGDIDPEIDPEVDA